MKRMYVLWLSFLWGLTGCAVHHSHKVTDKTDKQTTVRPEVWEVELLTVSGQGFAPLGITDKMGLIPVGLDVAPWNAGKATLRLSCPKDSSASVHRFCEALREHGQLQVIRLSRIE